MSQDHRSFLRRLTAVLGGLEKRRLFAKGYRESSLADRWTAEDILAYHDAKLTHMVRWAGRKIPFYRDLYRKAQVDLEGFSGVADLPRLPPISKADILRDVDKMIRPGVPELLIVRHTTGGSTGTIATLASQRAIADWENGCIYYLWSRVGVRRGDRMAVFRGALLDEGRTMFKADSATNSLIVSTYHLNDENVDRLIQAVDEFRPDWLHVYPSAASLVANILQRTSRRFSCKPKGVLCGSENVFDWQVQLFQETFGGKVYSHYGHGELAVLGGWCEGSRAFHFLPNHGYLELLDENGGCVTQPGVSAEMVGTGYLNTVMPLIRYRTADYGTWDKPGPCPSCGRHHQRLASIEGRVQEYLTLANGQRFPATNINALHGTFFSLIYRFQFVQREPGKASLRFVPAAELSERHLREIREAFAYLTHVGLELEFQPVKEIPLTSSGKQRIVITEGAG